MAKTAVKPAKTGKRILLVDDDKDINDAFNVLLQAGGYHVLQVYNGRQALEEIASFQPEIILLDLLMPVLDGNGFLREFNNEKQVPIIVFSSLDSHDEVREALENGATRYMLKAWATPEELFRIINDTI